MDTVEEILKKIDTDLKCPYGVARSIACQHSRCSTCDNYRVSIMIPKCEWEGWSKVDKWTELGKQR